MTGQNLSAVAPDTGETTAPGDKAILAKKAAPAKKATRSKRTAAAKKATSAAPAPRTREGFRTSAALRVLDHPGRAPELVALAAVEVLGPFAWTWAERLRATYPEAGPDGLARLATQRFTRRAAAGGALAAGTGVFAPVAEVAAAAWVHASVVLHVAAAYGHDPTDPERAVDLLVLTGVHPDAPSARAALDEVDTESPVDAPPLRRLAEAGRRLAGPFANRFTGWLAVRLAVRGMPGAASLAAAVGCSASVHRLSARAIARFRAADPTVA